MRHGILRSYAYKMQPALRSSMHWELTACAVLPLPPRRWGEISGKHISLQIGDLCDWEFFSEAFRSFAPDHIVHFGAR